MREIAEYSDRIWYSVEKIKDVKESTNGFEVLVSWKGLSSSGDSWEQTTSCAFSEGHFLVLFSVLNKFNGVVCRSLMLIGRVLTNKRLQCFLDTGNDHQVVADSKV